MNKYTRWNSPWFLLYSSPSCLNHLGLKPPLLKLLQQARHAGSAQTAVEALETTWKASCGHLSPAETAADSQEVLAQQAMFLDPYSRYSWGFDFVKSPLKSEIYLRSKFKNIKGSCRRVPRDLGILIPCSFKYKPCTARPIPHLEALEACRSARLSALVGREFGQSHP